MTPPPSSNEQSGFDSGQSDEAQAKMAQNAYRLLSMVRRIPGSDMPSMELRLQSLSLWIASVRSQGALIGLSEITDYKVGELLAHAKVGEDGIWPDEVVRDALEATRSEDMLRGAFIGRSNDRGLHAKTGTGDEEWKLAQQYRAWAKALRPNHPFVAKYLLEVLAESYEEDAKNEAAEGILLGINGR